MLQTEHALPGYLAGWHNTVHFGAVLYGIKYMVSVLQHILCNKCNISARYSCAHCKSSALHVREKSEESESVEVSVGNVENVQVRAFTTSE